MAKVTKNLSLDESAVQRGERYSALHDTSLSRPVSDFLMQLPIDEPTGPLQLAVRRLIGVGLSDLAPAAEARETRVYRDHLDSKYGNP